MRLFIGMAVATSLALSAAPALAFTYASAASMPSSRQFADPDSALDSMSSAFRDDTLTNNLQGSGARLAGQVMNFDGGNAGAYDDRSSASAPSFEPAHAWGATPLLSGAELYDQEPPFMPIVVGDTRR